MKKISLLVHIMSIRSWHTCDMPIRSQVVIIEACSPGYDSP